MVRSNSAGNNQIYSAIINGKEMTTNLSLRGRHGEGEGEGDEGVGVGSREAGRVSIKGEGKYHSVPSTPSYSLSAYEKDSRAISLKDSEFNFSAQNNHSHFNEGRSRDEDRDRVVDGGVGQTHGMNWPAVAPAQVSVEFTQRHVQDERIAVHTGAYEGMRGGNRIGVVGEGVALGGVGGEEGDTSSGLTSSPGVTTDSEGCSERQIDSRDGDNEVEGGDRNEGGGEDGGGEESEEIETTNPASHNIKDNTTINTNSIQAAKQAENLSSSSKGTNKKNKQQQKKKTQKK